MIICMKYYVYNFFSLTIYYIIEKMTAKKPKPPKYSIPIIQFVYSNILLQCNLK